MWGQETLLWFLWVGAGEVGYAGLGLASLNKFSGLWGIRAVSACLAPGPGLILAGG